MTKRCDLRVGLNDLNLFTEWFEIWQRRFDLGFAFHCWAL